MGAIMGLTRKTNKTSQTTAFPIVGDRHCSFLSTLPKRHEHAKGNESVALKQERGGNN